MCHEEWYKIWRWIDLSIQNFHDRFWPKHSKVSKIYSLMGSFWPKYIIFELKNYRGVILIALEIGGKFERKVADAFKNNMRNFANFHRLKNSDLILES